MSNKRFDGKTKPVVVVNEDVLFPPEWTFNSKGNKIKKARLLPRGWHIVERVERFTTLHDTYNCFIVKYGGYEFYVGENFEIDEITVKWTLGGFNDDFCIKRT